jgi:hypothetical protein
MKQVISFKEHAGMETVEPSVLSSFSPEKAQVEMALGRKPWQSTRWHRGQLRRTGALHAEVALMWAILEDALKCYQHGFLFNNHQALVLANEAEAWLFSDDTSYLFSCVNICAVLDLDPQHLRQGLLRWSRCAQHGQWNDRSAQKLSLD